LIKINTLAEKQYKQLKNKHLQSNFKDKKTESLNFISHILDFISGFVKRIGELGSVIKQSVALSSRVGELRKQK